LVAATKPVRGAVVKPRCRLSTARQWCQLDDSQLKALANIFLPDLLGRIRPDRARPASWLEAW
jgi:hypothetical protein